MSIFSTKEQTMADQLMIKGFAEAVRKAGAYTVMVDARRRRPSAGILYAKGLILTAQHALEREQEIKVTLPSGEKVTGSLAGRDPIRDLAVVRVEGQAPQEAPVPAPEARVGEIALSVTRTSFDGINASFGIVGAAGSRLPFWKGGVIESYYQLDPARSPGFTGSPVVDTEGRLIGIHVFGVRFGLELVIPAGLAMETAARIAAHGSIRRGQLGIRSQEVEIPESLQGSVKGQRTGLLLVGVENNSPAAVGGLMLGDIVVRFDGAAIESHQALIGMLTDETIGRKVPVELLRGGALKTLSVTVAAAP
jgi:S1-C subfamily serine protease